MLAYTHNKPIKKNQKRGFTLLEVVIAVFLITVGITAVFLLTIKTINQMTVSSSRLTAAYLTQEGIEIARNIRDTNWIEQGSDASIPWDDGLSTGDWEAAYNDSTLFSYSGNPLNIETATDFYGYDAGTTTKFKRKITIDNDGSNIFLKVTVLVEWAEKGKTYSHTAQENLYNWR